MTARRPIAAGVAAAFRHTRAAFVLWLSLVLTAGLVWLPLRAFTAGFDDGPFRESLVRGWSPWGIFTWLAFRKNEWKMFLAVLGTALAAGALLQLFLTGGVLATLLADVPRPAFRRVVKGGAALFKPSLWAATRYVLSLALWGGVLVALPVFLVKKIGGDSAPPNGTIATARQLWTLAGGLFVFYAVSLRFDLSRIALARGEASNAREAYRLSRQRLKGARGRAIGIALVWTAVSLAIQALFTNLGVRWNPATGTSLAGLVLLRQLGFVLSAMARVGFWASLIRFDELRR